MLIVDRLTKSEQNLTNFTAFTLFHEY